MNKDIERTKAKSIMSNGRLLIIVTALPLIGSLVKFFYNDTEAVLQGAETQNSVEILIDSFPSITLNEMFTLDHFIVLGFTVGLIIGVLTLKKGISQIIKLDNK